MRVMPDDDGLGWRRHLDERARRQVTELVPRPGCPIYGLAAPAVRPVTLAEAQLFDGKWTQITLGYGPWDATAGPYLRVTTALIPDEITSPGGMQVISSNGMHGIDAAAELRLALREEARRPAALAPDSGAAGSVPAVPAEVPAVVSERLPAGPALVVRQGTIWAARLVPDDASGDGGAGSSGNPGTPDFAGAAGTAVVVTIVGRDVAPEDVRLETLADLREAIDGRLAEVARVIAERKRHPRPAPPPPDLEPAEGVAALRALTDFIVAGQADRRAAARARRQPGEPPPPQPAGQGGMHSALWRRAVAEQQRVAGMDKQAADAVVTSVVNHLGHLAEKAPWFVPGSRLRAAATDETLRHAMLGDAVRSVPAQRAWAAYWSRPRPDPGRMPDPDGMRALHESWLGLESAWLGAWEAWARDA